MGSMVIDEFSQSVRAWDQSRHVHFTSATYGSCAAHGKTIEQAVTKLKELQGKSQPGFQCTTSCPEYWMDFY